MPAQLGGQRWGGDRGCAGTRAGVPKCCGCGGEPGGVYGMVHDTSTDCCTSAARVLRAPPTTQPQMFPLEPEGWERLPGPQSWRAGPVRHRHGDKQEDHSCGIKKAFSQIRDHIPGPSLPSGRKHKREKPQEEEAAWVQRHKGCAGQKHPSFPAAGQERTREGGRALRASLCFLCQPRHEAALIQMCRQIPAAPSPFREGCDGPCLFPEGPSHPSQKATVPRPLHLGPICCCWLPSLPPALNSDVFKHTHQRRRAAPGEPQLAAHFLLLAESGAQQAPAPGESGRVPASCQPGSAGAGKAAEGAAGVLSPQFHSSRAFWQRQGGSSAHKHPQGRSRPTGR